MAAETKQSTETRIAGKIRKNLEIKITRQLLRDLNSLRVHGQIDAMFLLYPSSSDIGKFNRLAIEHVFSVDNRSLKCFLSPNVWYDKHCMYMPCFDEFNATYCIAHLRTNLGIVHKLTQFDALKTLLVLECVSTTASDAAKVISDIVLRKNRAESDTPLRPGPVWYQLLSTDIIVSHTTIRGIIGFLFDVGSIDELCRHSCENTQGSSVYYDTRGRIFRVSVTDSDTGDFYMLAVYQCDDARDVESTLALLNILMEGRATDEDDVWVCLSRCISIRSRERCINSHNKNKNTRNRQYTLDFFHPIDGFSFLGICRELTMYLLNSDTVDVYDGGIFHVAARPGLITTVEYIVGIFHETAPFEIGHMHPVMLRMSIKNFKLAHRSATQCIKAPAQICNGHDNVPFDDIDPTMHAGDVDVLPFAR